VHVIDGFVDGDAPSTKSALVALRHLTERPRVLVVLTRADQVNWLSLRNDRAIHVVAVDQLNTYDVLVSDDVVFTRAAYDALLDKHRVGESGSEADT
jgi:large subunit ribosomal protein L4